MTEELDTWDNGVPVIDIGNNEFDVWDNGVPVLDNPQSVTPPPSTPPRRRACIF